MEMVREGDLIQGAQVDGIRGDAAGEHGAVVASNEEVNPPMPGRTHCGRRRPPQRFSEGRSWAFSC